MKSNYLSRVDDLIRTHSEDSLSAAIEIQKLTTSMALEQRLVISPTRKEGYNVGWNAATDAFISLINGNNREAHGSVDGNEHTTVQNVET